MRLRCLMGFLKHTTNELADSAVRKKQSGECITWPSAIRKAIIGKGITSKLDVARLTTEVARNLSDRGLYVQRKQKDALARAKRIVR